MSATGRGESRRRDGHSGARTRQLTSQALRDASPSTPARSRANAFSCSSGERRDSAGVQYGHVSEFRPPARSGSPADRTIAGGTTARSRQVAVRRSVREGFDLVVSEALWQGSPLVTSKVGGIPPQPVDGRTQSLFDTNGQWAAMLLSRLQRRDETDRLVATGVARVRDNLPTTRYLRGYRTISGQRSGLTPATRRPQQ